MIVLLHVETSNMSNTRVSNSYKIVLDNFDWNIRASYQQINRTIESFHCVHLYAALDQIDFSSLCDDIRRMQTKVDLNSLLPTKEDVKKINEDFGILISR